MPQTSLTFCEQDVQADYRIKQGMPVFEEAYIGNFRLDCENIYIAAKSKKTNLRLDAYFQSELEEKAERHPEILEA